MSNVTFTTSTKRTKTTARQLYSPKYEDELKPIKAESFFRLNFNAYTDLDNRERATARDKTKKQKKNKEDEFFNRGRISSVGIALYSCILQSGRSRVRFPGPEQYSGLRVSK